MPVGLPPNTYAPNIHFPCLHVHTCTPTHRPAHRGLTHTHTHHKPTLQTHMHIHLLYVYLHSHTYTRWVPVHTCIFKFTPSYRHAIHNMYIPTHRPAHKLAYVHMQHTHANAQVFTHAYTYWLTRQHIHTHSCLSALISANNHMLTCAQPHTCLQIHIYTLAPQWRHTLSPGPGTWRVLLSVEDSG